MSPSSSKPRVQITMTMQFTQEVDLLPEQVEAFCRNMEKELLTPAILHSTISDRILRHTAAPRAGDTITWIVKPLKE